MMSINSKLLHHGYAMSVLAFKNSIKSRVLDVKRNAFLPYCRFSSQEVFTGETDVFKGITVDTLTVNHTKSNFEKVLEDSLNHWNSEGKRCIWFRVNINDASLVPILAKKGFNFHHAREGFVMMYKWLPKDVDPNLPPASYTNVGVGAMVFNKEGKLLTISEKSYDYPHWKLPGGYVEKGEDLIDAARREVREETGIESEFESIVTFRHTHESMFGNSDIYVLIMMKALTEQIAISQREIKDCKWMDVNEYTTHPDVHKLNKLMVVKALEYKKNNIKLNFPKETIRWSKYVREMNFLLIDKYN